MTDHEGMIASLNPKLTDKAALEKRNAELQKAIAEAQSALTVFFIAAPIIILLIAMLLIFGPEIEAWRLSL
jgi:hypothetical protein